MKKNKKILIIDDDQDFGLALKFFFAKKNFDLLLAHTLSEGMLILEREKPEYVFLDNCLPDGLGRGKSEYIHAQYPHSNLYNEREVKLIRNKLYQLAQHELVRHLTSKPKSKISVPNHLMIARNANRYPSA